MKSLDHLYQFQLSSALHGALHGFRGDIESLRRHFFLPRREPLW
jgi:hypothetical protein